MARSELGQPRRTRLEKKLLTATRRQPTVLSPFREGCTMPASNELAPRVPPSQVRSLKTESEDFREKIRGSQISETA